MGTFKRVVHIDTTLSYTGMRKYSIRDQSAICPSPFQMLNQLTTYFLKLFVNVIAVVRIVWAATQRAAKLFQSTEFAVFGISHARCIDYVTLS